MAKKQSLGARKVPTEPRRSNDRENNIEQLRKLLKEMGYDEDNNEEGEEEE